MQVEPTVEQKLARLIQRDQLHEDHMRGLLTRQNQLRALQDQMLKAIAELANENSALSKLVLDLKQQVDGQRENWLANLVQQRGN